MIKIIKNGESRIRDQSQELDNYGSEEEDQVIKVKN